jgi:adenosine deaminase
MLPKAELHLHLEGAISPDLAKKLAKKHQLTLAEGYFGPNNTFAWRDFLDFLDAYENISQVIRTPEDYRDVTYEYLKQCAEEGVIYVEIMPSPDHAALWGLGYNDMLGGVVQGIDDAKREFGIECRIMITGVRHFGAEKVEQVAKLCEKYPHPLVTGFAIGGDEAGFPPKQFAKAYQIAHGAGLSCMCHAGEWSGPEGIWEAIEHLPLKRIGHGVRSIEDPKLIQTIIERDIVLEVAPGSNIALQVYPDYAHHPLLKLRDAGIKVTLNSDDPPFFGTTIGQEYANAKKHFGLDDDALLDITRTAINAAFVDEATRKTLLSKLGN